MMLFSLVLLVSSLAANDDWTTLPLPSWCRTEPVPAHPLALWNGSHLRMSAEAQSSETGDRGPKLSVATLMQMIEEDAREHGTKLEFFRGTPGLLVHGDAAAIAGARALIADLERASDAASIDLDVSLATRAAGMKANDPKKLDDSGHAIVEAGASEARFKKRVGSGERACFGVRREKSFVASFAVEVAADSGVAAPVLGEALSGTTLHLTAARVDGGRRVHLFGLLDRAEIAEIATFDPKTPDLGLIQEPLIESAQIVFAGVVDSGGTLEVALEGSGLSQPDCSLRIQATTRPDPEPSAGAAQGWAVFDLALLAGEARTLPAFGPGAGLDAQAVFAESAETAGVLSPSAIAAALDSGRSSASSTRTSSKGASDTPTRAPAPMYWTGDLLFVPRSDDTACRAARALVQGAEAARVATGRIELRLGDVHASVPVCAGFPARILVGHERSWLVDYRAEIAPQTWMPAPDVQTTFDGLSLSVQPSASQAQCSFWVARSEPAIEIERSAAQLGRLQLLARALSADSARIAANQPEHRVLDLAFAPAANTADSAALMLRFNTP